MFLDLSKAYDCLDRELLVRKLEMYGIRGNAHKWLVSYVNNRIQTVSVTKDGKTSRSNFLNTEFGIAQGSVLGPVLFIIFINDLCNTLDVSRKIVKYADDTNLLIGGCDRESILNQGRWFLNDVNQWFTQNRLILNESKTNIMLFRTKHSKTERPAHFNNGTYQIPFADNTKFLGIVT